MRFALKSRRSPHIPVATDAPKSLRKEIERRLDVVKDIKYEPRLINEWTLSEGQPFDHFYRMEAVDSLKRLEEEILESVSGDVSKKRPPGQDLRFYLQRLSRDSGPLSSCDSDLINQFVNSYNHARHEPEPNFTQNEYKNHIKILNSIIQSMGHKEQLPKGPFSQLSKGSSVTINGQTYKRGVNEQSDVETRV